MRALWLRKRLDCRDNVAQVIPLQRVSCTYRCVCLGRAPGIEGHSLVPVQCFMRQPTEGCRFGLDDSSRSACAHDTQTGTGTFS
eukprot:4489571-Amphidinium_carterae.1